MGDDIVLFDPTGSPVSSVDAVSHPETPVDLSPPVMQLWPHPFRSWSPQALQSAKDNADQGVLELPADLWESMMADDRISGALEQRILASESLPLHFVGSPRGVKRLEKLWNRLISPGLRAELFRWGWGVGVCPLYVRGWKDGEPTQLEVWHPRWLRYYWWERRWKILTMGGIIDLDSQPGRWYLFAPFGLDFSRPHLTGFWYSLATQWLLKSYALTDLANFGQQHATPKWFMSVQDGNATVSKPEKDAAIKWLARIPSRSSMFVPYPFKVEQHETNSQAWQAFVKATDYANAAVARRILGHEASMDKDSTRASGLTALDVKTSLVRFDVDSEREFWRQGLLRTVADVQGWPGETPYPDRDSTPPEDLETASKTQLTAAQALATLTDKSLDGDIDTRAFLGRYFPLLDVNLEGDTEAPTDGIQLSRSNLDALPEGSSVRLDARTGTVTLLETDFPKQGGDDKVSLRNSQYKIFDPDYVDKLKEDWPQIWKRGGNIRGNEQYRKLRPVIARGGAPDGPAEEKAVRLREAWAARHYRNNRLAGVVALMKWFVVGAIGEKRMKAVVEAEKDRLRKQNSHTVEILKRSKDVRRQAREGLAYRDTVVDELLAQDAVKDPANQILRVLADAKGYDDARERLQAAFPELDRAKLRDVLTGGLLLTQAAGMLTAGRENE